MIGVSWMEADDIVGGDDDHGIVVIVWLSAANFFIF